MDEAGQYCERCRRDADTLSAADGGFRRCATCGAHVCADCWNLVSGACLACAPFSLPTETTSRQQRPKPDSAAVGGSVAGAGKAGRRSRRPKGQRHLPGRAARRLVTLRNLATGLAGGGTVVAGILVATLAFSSLAAGPAGPAPSQSPSPAAATAATAATARPSSGPAATRAPTHPPAPRYPPDTTRPPYIAPRPVATPVPTPHAATPRPRATPRPIQITPPPVSPSPEPSEGAPTPGDTSQP